jgi:Major tropism determinant N-terminal domain
MAKQLQLRRGSTAQHSSFTGAVGEITIDTDKDTLVVHDGYTQGGEALLREDLNNLANNSIGLSKIATGTHGQVLYYNASGQLVALNPGTSGYTLQTNGAGQNPSWGLRGVLQIVNRIFTDSGSFTITTSDQVFPGTNLSITSMAANSKFLILFRAFGEMEDAWNNVVNTRRNGSRINGYGGTGNTNVNYASHMFTQTYGSAANYSSTPEVISYQTLDAPNVAAGTTLTYDMAISAESNRGCYYNRATDADEYGSTETIIMEIAA